MAGETILVVDDEATIVEVVAYALRAEGFLVVTAADGRTGWKLFQTRQPDLVILDLTLPGIPGYELLRKMHEVAPRMPVILLTCRDGEAERVRGLEAGADDYVTKPFSTSELVSRVRAVLRRCATGGAGAETMVRRGPLVIEPQAYRVTYFGKPVPVTRHEWIVIECLVRHPRRVFTRESLVDLLYRGEGGVSDRSVDALIKRIRAKFRHVRRQPDPIQTVYGLGYTLNPDLEAVG